MTDQMQANRTANPSTTDTERDAPGTATADELLVSSENGPRPTLSVVMPTLNEEAGVRKCIEQVKSALVELDVTGEIIVSDSSSDRTPEIAAELGARVVTPDGMGYGYAYKYAFERARGDYVVIGDADTTYDFEELPKLLELVREGDADMVLGSRLDGKIKSGAMPPLHQYVGNPLLTKFLNVFYDAGVSDAHSGFRVIDREVLDRLDLRSDGMEFASEMIMEASAKGLRIEEVPITYHEREGEATLDSFRDGWRHVKFMLINAPSYLFSVPGLAFFLFGVLTMALTLADARLGNATLGINSMIAGSLLTIIGFQIATLAVFSSIAADPIKRPRDFITNWIRAKFKLEHGASMGLLLYSIGTVYVTLVVAQWATSGYDTVPFAVRSMVAFTAIVLGTQTIFSSFFFSMLAQAQD
ncbi:glycosyltransferase family 2 protein [Halorussus caseinilyticus]|uniref:Glycosyltransferase family 2 protein n=1 Tax=Halorussus caseinilyticus TaxID=3034025 RepID=A0ABD5WRW5_9EURY|nr:glycosyltransferase family 2 protein [Halorussus sp. DT72]